MLAIFELGGIHREATRLEHVGDGAHLREASSERCGGSEPVVNNVGVGDAINMREPTMIFGSECTCIVRTGGMTKAAL